MSGGRYTLFRSDSIERQASLKFSKHRQYQAVLIASLAATAAGTLDGWMMMSVNMSGKAEYNSMAVYHFISYMFAIIGAVTFGVISDNIGRKFALIIIGIVMLPVWILYMFANAWTVAAGLVLSGLAAGGATVAVPLYISDIADRSSRAILIVIFYQLFIAGELVTFFGNPKERLASTASFGFLIALIFVLTFIWMPESPYHLISVGREIDARKSLEFFCGDWDVDTQVALIKESTKNKKSLLAHIRDKSLRTPLLILAGLTTLSRLVAVDSFNYRLIKRHFYHNNEHVHANANEAIKLGFGVNLALQLIVMGLGAFLIEKYGRRKLLYISSFGISILAVPLMFAPFLSGYELILLPLLFLYIGAFSIGLATIPWILAGDLFAPEHKTVSYTVNAVLFWGMASFAPERLILAIRYFSNFFGVYFLFLTIAVVLYIKSVIPETKDSNPSDIRAEIDALISRFQTRQTTTPAAVVNGFL
ncbi:hypothetical protein LSTR_LSTR009165 [Laodelphax striatellus]|uniref:Major facilitator superfamily (MFS) profile domain-containing protein n=1 Tax=Laodelphax striatellus TaxID=195883 RepID=A0A482XDH8_LAOST|nr:hypothetical protein LSTR_LSTR009165 [Laodelphax striatellus]